MLIAQGLILVILLIAIIRNLSYYDTLRKLFVVSVLTALPFCFLSLAKYIATKKIICVDLFGMAYFSGYVVACFFLIL